MQPLARLTLPLLLLAAPADATLPIPCAEPACEVIASGAISGSVSLGSECSSWFVGLAIGDEQSNVRLLPSLFDQLLTPDQEGQSIAAGPGFPNFDTIVAGLTDGASNQVFLTYYAGPDAELPGAFGSSSESELFQLPTVDLAGQQIAAIRLTPDLICTFVVATIEVLPEPGGAGSALAALVALGLLTRRR